VPIMNAPLRSSSLADFWGLRWNLGFNGPARELLLKPLTPHVGAATASLLIFILSGLLHELVISVPARGGYGLPSAYFLLQAAGMRLERSPAGRRLGLA